MKKKRDKRRTARELKHSILENTPKDAKSTKLTSAEVYSSSSSSNISRLEASHTSDDEPRQKKNTGIINENSTDGRQKRKKVKDNETSQLPKSGSIIQKKSDGLDKKETAGRGKKRKAIEDFKAEFSEEGAGYKRPRVASLFTNNPEIPRIEK